jgi:hypothetical protein
MIGSFLTSALEGSNAIGSCGRTFLNRRRSNPTAGCGVVWPGMEMSLQTFDFA